MGWAPLSWWRFPDPLRDIATDPVGLTSLPSADLSGRFRASLTKA